ncbi:MipA/OmpV family protein [Massilia forsythiae]|uniref:MipA/OmpV family protein n=1 Tax=Massilia forsythiae TaxID=2728020 RepID=A0A7Z2VU65_9BURK|nr:MipA/OmpV family protein [Massilia forsythiae]QJD99177.1 MipA/OmpV family protein [Massilia forsythiae]
MRSISFPALALGGAILSCAAHAGALEPAPQSAPPEAIASAPETRLEPVDPGLPLWEAGIGAASFATPAYPGASDRSNRVLALPFLIYRGKVLRADQNGVGARLLNTDKVEFDIGFAAALPADSDDVAARRGMPDLGTLVEFGPRVKFKFADLGEYGRMRAELPLRTVIEGRGGLRRQGWTTEPRLVWERRADDGCWTVEGQLGALFGDRRINRYFYEVAPRYATVDRAAYAADAGLMLVRTGVFGTWRMNPDVRVFGFVRYESYAGAANRDSPLMRKSTGASAGIGFAWTLARSAARARVAE